MLTPRIKSCYLPVLQSSETLVGSADHQKMNRSSTIEKPWGKVPIKQKLEKKIDLDSLVSDLKNSDETNYVNNYIETEEELGDKKKKIIQDIDIINKHVNRKEIEIRNLKQANAKLLKTNEELRLMSEEFMKKYQDELREKLVVVKDNQKLASKIQQLAIIKGESVDDKKYEILVATIKDKDNKLTKLTELIAPFRKKVKEQESLRAELTLANGEKKGLMEVNEEIVREIASLNDRHLKAIANKDKQLAMLQEKSSRLMEETKRILEAEKSDFAGQGAKLALEKKRVEELKRSVDAEKIAIEDAKTSLTEEKKSIEDSRKMIDEEYCVIGDEKRVIDEEWGEIVRKKNQIKDTEREISEQVKGLIKENEKAIEEKSELEIELSKAQAEFKKTKSESKLAEQLRKSEDTVEEILKKNEDVIESLQSENRQIILEFKKKEHLIDDMNKKHANQEDVLMKSEIKLKEEISFKDGMIKDLEFKVTRQKEKMIQEKEEHSGVLMNNKEEMERLKIKIVVLSNNNKRRMSEEECCNNSKKFKPSDESIEMNTEVKVLGNEQETPLIHDNLTSKEAIIDEVGEVLESTNEEEHQLSAIVDGVNVLIHEEISSVEITSSNPSELENEENAKSEKLPKNDSSVKTDSSTDSSALKLIAAMNDFESLIKSSRDQDTIEVQVVAQPEPMKKNVPELDKANELIKQVEDIIGQTKIINIINTAKKSKSIRDVFDDSDDESEHEVTNDKSETGTVQADVLNSSSKQTIKVRDMTTICESRVDKVDSDVVIPTDSGDISIDISEEDETVKRLALEDVNKLKSQVSDVVKLSLSKFFKIVDGVQTKEDLESLTESFSKQFTEEITCAHLERHASIAGISMTRYHKRSLVDQIIFYFEIKKSVNMNLRKHIHPSSPQFVILSSELSNQFSKDIMESHRTMFNSLTGLALTPDNHQWIGNIINFKMSQCEK